MDEFDADVFYVDTRNADHRDHRSRTGTLRPASGRVPAPRAVTSFASATPYVRPVAATPTVYPVAAPPTAYPVAYPAQVYPAQGPIANLFGAMPVGQILELVAMAFAALQPLPSAPTATRDASTDLSNLILYQAALAQHAKRDEQVRTLGSLVGKLVS